MTLQNQMVRRHFFLICLCISISILPVCASASAATDKELIKLRATVLPYFGFAPLYIADTEGFFTDEGLSVEFVSLKISLQLIRLSKNTPELAGGIFSSESGKMKISGSEKTPRTC